MTTALLEFTDSLIYPLGQYSELIGGTVEGVEGAVATVLLNGQPVVFPFTLQAGDSLTLLRAQSSTEPEYLMITRLYGQHLASTDPFVVTADPDGYQTITNATAITDTDGYQTIQDATGTPDADGYETVARSTP